jgi:carbon storage regulator
MLILTRSLGQRVIINHDLIITVTQLQEHGVKLGFDAPSQYKIWREEIYNKIKAELSTLILAGNSVYDDTNNHFLGEK